MAKRVYGDDGPVRSLHEVSDEMYANGPATTG
jgi:hypothetical protein